VISSRRSLYIPMRDGVRIAIDVFLPALESGQVIPTVLHMTRYQRATAIPAGQPDKFADFAAMFTTRGYAFVTVDARGTGASFGTRQGEITRSEIEDYGEILTWIAAQVWSNGRIGSYGVSYDGDTAEMVAVLGHPALRAVSPQFNDFDPYDDLFCPGGILNDYFSQNWTMLNNALDALPGAYETVMQALGLSSLEEAKSAIGLVRPVDGADGPRLLEAAILEHRQNVRGAENLRDLPFKDDTKGESTYNGLGAAFQAEIEASNVPMLVFAGWQDAGTTSGTLCRFAAFSNHQEVYIGTWNHGGEVQTDPFLSIEDAPKPTRAEQFEIMFAFFDRFVKQEETPQRHLKRLHYATNGESTWRTLESWSAMPVQRWYLHEGQILSQKPVTIPSSLDFQTDFTFGTGDSSRWRTQSGGTPVAYPDWHKHQLISYSTAPLEQDLRVLGFPTVQLELRSSTPDGAIYVYLEDVDPTGVVRLITEGQLRLLHRKKALRNTPERSLRTARTFARADQLEVVPDQLMTIELGLIPTSTLFKKGHSIRISLAGHDQDTFARYAADRQVYRLEHRGAYLELPIAPEAP
jgi:uncharacterized protein